MAEPSSAHVRVPDALDPSHTAVDTSSMRGTWLADLVMWVVTIVVIAGVTGCHLRAGLDATARANGPLHGVMTQATVSRTTGVINLPNEGGRNYSLEAGFGNKTFTVNSLFAVHDVSSTSFTPGAGYLAGTIGVDVRWSVLTWKNLTPSVAAGPVRMMLLDRTSGERTWGNGLRFGAGAQYKLGPIAVYGELYREVVVFDDGAADGTTKLDGLTFGLALQP